MSGCHSTGFKFLSPEIQEYKNLQAGIVDSVLLIGIHISDSLLRMSFQMMDFFLMGLLFVTTEVHFLVTMYV